MQRRRVLLGVLAVCAVWRASDSVCLHAPTELSSNVSTTAGGFFGELHVRNQLLQAVMVSLLDSRGRETPRFAIPALCTSLIPAREGQALRVRPLLTDRLNAPCRFPTASGHVPAAYTVNYGQAVPKGGMVVEAVVPRAGAGAGAGGAAAVAPPCPAAGVCTAVGPGSGNSMLQLDISRCVTSAPPSGSTTTAAAPASASVPVAVARHSGPVRLTARHVLHATQQQPPPSSSAAAHGNDSVDAGDGGDDVMEDYGIDIESLLRSFQRAEGWSHEDAAADEDGGSGSGSSSGMGHVKAHATLELVYRANELVGSAPVDKFEGVTMQVSTRLEDLLSPRPIAAGFQKQQRCGRCNWATNLSAIPSAAVFEETTAAAGDGDGAALLPGQLPLVLCPRCDGSGLITTSHTVPHSHTAAAHSSTSDSDSDNDSGGSASGGEEEPALSAVVEQVVTVTCPRCLGQGTVTAASAASAASAAVHHHPPHGSTCSSCGGSRYVEVAYTHLETIPAGVSDAWQRRHEGAGGVVAGKLPADILVKIKPAVPTPEPLLTSADEDDDDDGDGDAEEVAQEAATQSAEEEAEEEELQATDVPKPRMHSGTSDAEGADADVGDSRTQPVASSRSLFRRVAMPCALPTLTRAAAAAAAASTAAAADTDTAAADNSTNDSSSDITTAAAAALLLGLPADLRLGPDPAGPHLVVTVTVTVEEALHGFNATVPILLPPPEADHDTAGSGVQYIRISRQEPLLGPHVLVLPGRGLPLHLPAPAPASPTDPAADPDPAAAAVAGCTWEDADAPAAHCNADILTWWMQQYAAYLAACTAAAPAGPAPAAAEAGVRLSPHTSSSNSSSSSSSSASAALAVLPSGDVTEADPAFTATNGEPAAEPAAELAAAPVAWELQLPASALAAAGAARSGSGSEALTTFTLWAAAELAGNATLQATAAGGGANETEAAAEAEAEALQQQQQLLQLLEVQVPSRTVSVACSSKLNPAAAFYPHGHLLVDVHIATEALLPTVDEATDEPGVVARAQRHLLRALHAESKRKQRKAAAADTGSGGVVMDGVVTVSEDGNIIISPQG